MTATVRFQFEAGILAWRLIRDAANYGRALGLDVELHYSGWLQRSGWLVARGPEPEAHEFDRYLTRLAQIANRGVWA